MSLVRIGILGCGRQGKVHASSIVAANCGAQVAAVYDAMPESAQALAAGHPHRPRVAASVEDMLADKSIDAIMIVTPNFTHAELLEKVATAGKHCVVEKPLDSDLGKIERMREALAKLPQPLPYISVGFPKRHDDSVKAMRSTLLSGSIGPLESLIVHHRDLLPQPVEYMKTSGTLINDSCVHDFDIAISMISLDGDRPAKLSTFGSILISPEACKEANDITRVCIQIMTQKGKLVTVHSARRCVTGTDERLEAHCERGDVVVENQPRYNLTTKVATADSAAIHPPIWTQTAERFSDALINQIKELTAACRGELDAKHRVGSTVDEGYWASRTVKAAITSLREGRQVEV